MAHYAYKHACYGIDYEKYKELVARFEKEEGREHDGDSNYDGDNWYIVAMWIEELREENTALRAELVAVRELMNNYNLGGWTDALGPMQRALQAEAELAALKSGDVVMVKKCTQEERSWPEDSGHENGNYYCTCHHCQRQFIGHKRRVTCKVCDAMLAAAPGVQAGEKDNAVADSRPD